MNNLFLILFLILMLGLLLSFLISIFSKNRPDEAKDVSQTTPILNPWMIPSLLQTLNTSGLITTEEFERLDGKTFEEIEEYVLQQEIFDSHQEFIEWMIRQPDIMGAGDSVFGGIDRFDKKRF